jgi:hypothetical protein
MRDRRVGNACSIVAGIMSEPVFDVNEPLPASCLPPPGPGACANALEQVFAFFLLR